MSYVKVFQTLGGIVVCSVVPLNITIMIMRGSATHPC